MNKQGSEHDSRRNGGLVEFLRRRVIVLVLSSVLCTVLGWMAVEYYEYRRETLLLRETLLEERRAEIQAHVNSAEEFVLDDIDRVLNARRAELARRVWWHVILAAAIGMPVCLIIWVVWRSVARSLRLDMVPLIEFFHEATRVGHRLDPGTFRFHELALLARGASCMIEARDQSESQLRATLDSMGDGVISTDIHGTIVSMNPMAEKLTQQSMAGSRGKPIESIMNLILAGSRSVLDNPVRRAIREGVAVGMSNGAVLVLPDQSERQIAHSTSPIRDASGDIVGAVLILRDVTEYYRARIALEDKEAFQRALLQSLQAGVAVIDPSTRTIESANRAAAAICGVSITDMLGAKCSQFMCQSQGGECPLAELDHSICNCEEVMTRADGSQVVVLKTVLPIELRGRRKVIHTFVDISELKASQEAVRKSNERFHQIAEVSREVVWETDASGRFTYVNNVAEEVLGYRSEDLVGKRCFYDLHPESYRAEIRQTVFATAGSGEPVRQWMGPIEREDGQVIWVSRNALSILGPDGALLGYRGSDLDVTQQRNVESLLRESQERLETVLHAAQDAIIMLDSVGNISMWNDAATRIFGYSAGEVVGENLHTLLTPSRYLSAHQQAFPLFQRAGTGKAIGQLVEVSALRRGGEEFPVELSLSAVKLRGEWHAVGILRDITSRKRNEERLATHVVALEAANRALAESNRKAEAATRAKSEFLANMSHEIRTPMTAILGFADFLRGESDLDRAPAARRDAIETIHRNGQYLLTLINDVLDLSKIEADRFEIERTACSPNEVLAEVVSLMRVRAESKSLPLTVRFASPLPSSIQSDPRRLRQILINLVGNAIKFTQQGTVHIEAQFLAGDDAADRLQFDVVDTGIGIAPDQIERLFQPFTQADSSTTRRFGGTGLGLTISKRLAVMLGGDIVVQSSPGEGSRFSVTIAAQRLEGATWVESFAESSLADAESNTVPPQAVRLGGRILLAEDGPDNQRLIAFILRKAGAELTLVENGRLACEQVRAAVREGKPYDLILMDMQMPVMDGYSAVRTLREEGYRETIVALTAHAMEGDERECLAAGCDAYLSKPINHAKFLPTIARFLAPQPGTMAASWPVDVPASFVPS